LEAADPPAAAADAATTRFFMASSESRRAGSPGVPMRRAMTERSMAGKAAKNAASVVIDAMSPVAAKSSAETCAVVQWAMGGVGSRNDRGGRPDSP